MKIAKTNVEIHITIKIECTHEHVWYRNAYTICVNTYKHTYIECKIYDKLFLLPITPGVAVIMVNGMVSYYFLFTFFYVPKILATRADVAAIWWKKALYHGYTYIYIERRNGLKNFQPKLFSVVQLRFFRFCVFPPPNPIHCLLWR